MSDEPKFCRDCKHYQPIPPVGLWIAQRAQNDLCGWGSKLPTEPVAVSAFRDYCRHPSKRDLVNGFAAEDPKMMRAGSCGPDALLWEEKPTPEVILPEKPPVSTWEAHPAPEIQRLQAEWASAQEPKGKWWEFWK
jgi:hypothetical protein